MLTRREVLERGLLLGTGAVLFPAGCRSAGRGERGVWVNDVHSGLNRTRVRAVLRPAGVEELRAEVAAAAARGETLSVAGCRHAMGGQQFATDALLLDTGRLARVGALDRERGVVDVEAGIRWPELIERLAAEQAGEPRPWSIRQKQTGADRLSLGGALAANAHGRGLDLPPIVSDVESFTLVDAAGEVHTCSRTENAELFRLAIGGYGLFGVVASLRLRLAPRRKLRRVVEMVRIEDLEALFRDRIERGFLYGDFQYSIAHSDESFLREGVLACYEPVEDGAEIPESQGRLSPDDWRDLIALAHVDRAGAYRRYAEYYLSTSGQLYWSDTHQLSTYLDDYHAQLAGRLGDAADGSEMITEIYVPRAALTDFMEDVRQEFLRNSVDLVYGTIRLIRADEETFLAWAREPFACVIFNLHVQHDAAGLERARGEFRRLIDAAIERGGSYFLTYHRWATRDQVLACYPQLPELLRRKRAHDPEERFQSDWYRHYRALLRDLV